MLLFGSVVRPTCLYSFVRPFSWRSAKLLKSSNISIIKFILGRSTSFSKVTKALKGFGLGQLSTCYQYILLLYKGFPNQIALSWSRSKRGPDHRFRPFIKTRQWVHMKVQWENYSSRIWLSPDIILLMFDSFFYLFFRVWARKAQK